MHKNKHPLKSNAEGYGGKTHQPDSEDSDTTASSGRKLYYYSFSVPVASPGTFGYTYAHRRAALTCVMAHKYNGKTVSFTLTATSRSKSPTFFFISVLL
jgi:hypothetical protein